MATIAAPKPSLRNALLALGAVEGEVGWLGAEAVAGDGAGVMVPGIVVGSVRLPDSPGTVVSDRGIVVGSPGLVVGNPGMVVGSPGIVVGSPGMVVPGKGQVVGSGIEVSVSVLEVGKEEVGMLESPPGMEDPGMVTVTTVAEVQLPEESVVGMAMQLGTVTVEVTGEFSGQQANSQRHLSKLSYLLSRARTFRNFSIMAASSIPRMSSSSAEKIFRTCTGLTF